MGADQRVADVQKDGTQSSVGGRWHAGSLGRCAVDAQAEQIDGAQGRLNEAAAEPL